MTPSLGRNYLYGLDGTTLIPLDWYPATEYVPNDFLTLIDNGAGRLTWGQVAQLMDGNPSEYTLWNNYPAIGSTTGYRGLSFGYNNPPAANEISRKPMEMTALDIQAAIEDLKAQGKNAEARKLLYYFVTMAHGITTYNANVSEAEKIDPDTFDFFGDNAADLQKIGHSAEMVAQMMATAGLAIENLFPRAVLLRAGRWVIVSERMSLRAAIYQARITGVPVETSYLVRGVKFDGIIGNVLIDAKGQGYARMISNGVFKSWFRGAKSLVKQARRQVEAAGGAPIEWHVAEEVAANAIRNLLQSEGITGITVIFHP